MNEWIDSLDLNLNIIIISFITLQSGSQKKISFNEENIYDKILNLSSFIHQKYCAFLLVVKEEKNLFLMIINDFEILYVCLKMMIKDFFYIDKLWNYYFL